MKIIITNYDDIKNPFYGGGGAIAIHQVAKRLAQKHQVTVLTSTYPKAKNLVRDQVTYRRIGTKLVGPKLGQLIFQLLLPVYAKTHTYDVWLESFTPPYSTAFLPWFTKKPVVGITHFLSAESMAQQYLFPFASIQNFGLKQYHYAIALTHHIKQKIHKASKTTKVSIIPNGIHTRRYQSRLKNPDPYILLIGRIHYYQKGIDLLLQAYKKAAKHSKLRLVIAGTGEKCELTKLKQDINKYQLESKVDLVGFVSGDEKIKLMRRAWCIAMPSRFEIQSLVILEALGVGTPVVGFDIPGLKWLPPEASLKVKSFSIKALASAFIEIQNPQIRAQLAKQSLKLANKYNWDKISQEYEALLIAISEGKWSKFS